MLGLLPIYTSDLTFSWCPNTVGSKRHRNPPDFLDLPTRALSMAVTCPQVHTPRFMVAHCLAKQLLLAVSRLLPLLSKAVTFPLYRQRLAPSSNAKQHSNSPPDRPISSLCTLKSRPGLSVTSVASRKSTSYHHISSPPDSSPILTLQPPAQKSEIPVPALS
jgi:hypothetical protein